MPLTIEDAPQRKQMADGQSEVNPEPPIHFPQWPNYGAAEEAAVVRVVRSNQLYADAEVRAFEDDYLRYSGSRYALGVGNATQGLHLALAALEVGEGHEVIVTPYSWISSASCVLMQNAVPVFCDIERESFGISPECLEKAITLRTRAIVVVHMFGYPCRITEIMGIANKHGIPVIEDISHAHGACVNGVMVGNFGMVGVGSLHQRKSLPVGDGGVVITNDKGLADKVFRLRSFGDNDLSYNYRMTEFAGALGAIGLGNLEEQNEMRREAASSFAELLDDHPALSVVLPRSNEVGVYYALLLRLKKPLGELDERLATLVRSGIPVRKTWSPLHRHPHFNPCSLPARGLPWKHPAYTGVMATQAYRDVALPEVDKWCPNRLLELYIHPPLTPSVIKQTAAQLAHVLK